MLRVHGRTSSINVRKVLWTLAELNVPFYHDERRGTPEAPADAPEFLRLNPNGLVPVITDAPGILRESNTICRYLATAHGRDDLLPTAPQHRAVVEMWMDWQATDLNSAWRTAFVALMRGNPMGATPAMIDASVKEWTVKMQILNDQLATTEAFVTGAEFTLADIVLGLSAHRYFSTPLPHAELPLVRHYVARLRERAGFSRYATAELP